MKHIIHHIQLVMLFFLVLASMTACEQENKIIPIAMEPTPDTMGYYCGMSLLEHAGPKGQIFVAGEPKPLWFSSLRETFSYLHLEGATRRILAIYVNNMSQNDWNHPGPWIDAKQAHYVVASQKLSPTGDPEIVPFAENAAAKLFSARHGGQIVKFAEVGAQLVLPNP